jgi:hypothetical protein
MKTASVQFFLWFFAYFAIAQSSLGIRLDTLSVPGLPGLHSFAAAQYDDKWLLIGGRKDGLHPKNGGFQTSSANQSIYIVDPATWQVWQRPLGELPDTLRDQLRSTNMEFFQQGETLLFIGGYGYSDDLQDHRTFPYLTLIDVPSVMSAVMSEDSLLPHFQQVRDTFFAVTGGQLAMLGDTFYLVGGHRFEGLYSANAGSNNIQFYTNAIRKFTLLQSNGVWSVTNKSQVIDELNLHRRDYNLVPQIFENGESGIGAFSGVFQPGLALLPFLNTVEIRPGGHASVNGFSQFLANYHCARLPVFSASQNEMHSLFFGGMSQYLLNENDSLIKDNRIPFVKTVSRVTRLADGSYEEVAFDAELPFYTGTSAEFLLAAGTPILTNGIVDLDALPDGETFIGHIVGGIVTPAGQPNPFLFNQAGQTSASAKLIKVFLQKNVVSGTYARLDGRTGLELSIFPNPASEKWNVWAKLPRSGELMLTLQNTQGRILRQHRFGLQPVGDFLFALPANALPTGGYWLTLNLDGVFIETKLTQKSQEP